jgi:hypothetical protein
VTEKLMTVAEPGLSRRARRWLIGFLTAYLVLYVATGIGGPRTHARQLQDKAQAAYLLAEQRVRDRGGLEQFLLEDGPTYRVSWCIPVIPGVLLTWSGYSAGPLARGEGGLKIVLYYGVGTHEVWKRLLWYD